MTTGQPPTHATDRLLAPDLARGAMLLLIALANVSAYLWGHESSDLSLHPVNEGILDTVVASFVILLVDGHVYPMFAFLFGYGITQFALSRASRSIPAQNISRMLVRRHLWMLLFGFVHAALLFGGDILGAYALTGLAVAPLVLRASDRTLRILMWTLGGIVVGMLAFGVLALLALGAFIPSEFTEIASSDVALPSTNDMLSGIDHWFIAMLVRVGWWIVSSVGAVMALAVPFMVLLGGFAARYRWLEGTTHVITLARVAIVGIGTGVVLALPAALGHVGLLESGELTSIGWFMLAQLAGLPGALGYVAAIALIARRVRPTGGAVRVLAAVGKRSLSAYLFQSVLFAPLLAAWGLGVGSQIGTATACAIAVGVWLLSALGAWALERRGAPGPAERILRRLTYGSDDPHPREQQRVSSLR